MGLYDTYTLQYGAVRHQNCLSLGGNLASVHNKQNFLKLFTKRQTGSYTRTWIGLHDGFQVVRSSAAHCPTGAHLWTSHQFVVCWASALRLLLCSFSVRSFLLYKIWRIKNKQTNPRLRPPLFLHHNYFQNFVWLWSDGTKYDFSAWNSGEPNNYEDTEHWAEMNFGGKATNHLFSEIMHSLQHMPIHRATQVFQISFYMNT
ncbi:uncharacterized protein LOC143484620 [Brachyhypopomus gauderio]|uniref:uncharacterized protein LOC143484620 n=1 Tax=Brachyhypopomus gauderio TaxID=698409 RepID=UPI004042F95A